MLECTACGVRWDPEAVTAEDVWEGFWGVTGPDQLDESDVADVASHCPDCGKLEHVYPVAA